ncbi:MAG: GTP-binding protein [Ruminococcaceae bacterium]|nr:GTP-binding protein [Oscillospiraceae bacterium]
MKKLVIGIIAHVDSGKTTLSEALLYNAGEIQKLGRVDKRDSFLDTNNIERDRGITIFSKQAEINLENTDVTILDTPGHVDFTSETERTLRVLDYAILVISGSDGVQSHSETLWKLLDHYNIPTFIFVNKTDLPACNRDSVILDIKSRLSEACFDFSQRDEGFTEEVALLDETLFSEYEEKGSFSDNSLKHAILSRKIFPCYFGSALKNEGVREFMGALDELTLEKSYPSELRARIYKVSEDERSNRLTHMKITGGKLKVKSVITINGKSEKINEIRIYSVTKFTPVNEASAGQICAVTGIISALPGDVIGDEISENKLLSEPVFTYSVKIEDGTDITAALAVFKKLEEEDTQMRVSFNEHLQKINVQIMGEIQLEVIKRVLDERFGLKAEFEHGSIIYKETISEEFEGVGHYEPLRHYSEVHLKISPGERGSGLTFVSECPENELDRNWQRLVISHLAEKEHLGVLTGSPLTDVKISLVSGKAHQKHTEGGDFRQATYRALRQGLMQAKTKNKCVLLEPWYAFVLEIPFDCCGRAMTDLSCMQAEYEVGESNGEISIIHGRAPVSAIREYNKQVLSYSHGKGKLSFNFDGYASCRNSEEVITDFAYDPEADLMNTPDSVFCSHGSGFLVKWHDVFSYMHIPLLKDKIEPVYETVKPKRRDYSSMIADEEEILRVFEATYGKIKRREPEMLKTPKEYNSYLQNKPKKIKAPTETYLLIDGYNIIFASDELKRAAEESLDLARCLLIDKVSSYQAMRRNNVILVFDAYKVKGGVGSVEQIHGISVIYTREAETADQYIEKVAKKLSKDYRVRVATSDGQIQMIIFGSGAARVTPAELWDEITLAEKEMREFIEYNNKI